MRTIKMTTDEFKMHNDDNNGVCLGCGEISLDGGVEPDAEEYECEACGEEKVMGLESALAEGHIEIDDDGEEDEDSEDEDDLDDEEDDEDEEDTDEDEF